MGLCKCSRKKVTNQFCYQHKENVCEHCMVSNHTKCIIQSYVLWLGDADFDPTCQLCKKDLAAGDCIRLICYHVFHWACLDSHARQLPPHTAPAGYTCPSCQTGIFPPSNMVSPVADTLRMVLGGVNWARAGLGLPLIDEAPSKEFETAVNWKKSQDFNSPPTSTPSDHDNMIGYSDDDVPDSLPPHSTGAVMGVHTTRPEPYGASYSTAHFSSPRKMYDTTVSDSYCPTLVDHDDDKYKRRSALEWLGRWFKSRTILGGNRRRDPHIIYKKWVVLLVLGLIGLCTVVLLFLHLGRASADTDPLLDPHLNPNIRVEDGINDFRAETSRAPLLPDVGGHNVVPVSNRRGNAELPVKT